MAFSLFIAVNAVLYIRPAELFPDLLGFNYYLVLTLLCIVPAVPDIFGYLTARPLDRQPMTLCVLGLLVVTFFPASPSWIWTRR